MKSPAGKFPLAGGSPPILFKGDLSGWSLIPVRKRCPGWHGAAPLAPQTETGMDGLEPVLRVHRATRTINLPMVGLSAPVVSRTRTLTSVSPGGNSKCCPMRAQYWTVVPDTTTRYSPSGERVHASCAERPSGRPVPSMNRQPRSLMASVIGCTTSNPNEAGTPPKTGGSLSQIKRLPSPSGRETITCKSGRTPGLKGSELKVLAPHARRLGPGLHSTTSEKP